MAGSSKKSMLSLHEKLTLLLTRVLEDYITELDKRAEAAQSEPEVTPELDLEGEFMLEVEKRIEINPAMLGVITKFLKDNEIKYIEEAADNVDKLRETLDAMKKRKVVSLSELRMADG